MGRARAAHTSLRSLVVRFRRLWPRDSLATTTLLFFLLLLLLVALLILSLTLLLVGHFVLLGFRLSLEECIALPSGKLQLTCQGRWLRDGAAHDAKLLGSPGAVPGAISQGLRARYEF